MQVSMLLLAFLKIPNSVSIALRFPKITRVVGANFCIQPPCSIAIAMLPQYTFLHVV